MSRTKKAKARTLSDNAHKQIAEYILETKCTRQEAADFWDITPAQARYAWEKHKRGAFGKITAKRKSAARLATKAEQIAESMTAEELVDAVTRRSLAQAYATKSIDSASLADIAMKVTRARRNAQIQRLVNHMKRGDAEVIIRLAQHLDDTLCDDDVIKLYWQSYDEVKAELSNLTASEEVRSEQ